MRPRRVVVVGGYGTFGSRAAERLARDDTITITIAGRHLAAAAKAAAALAARTRATIEPAVIDAEAPDLDVLRALRPNVIVNASGPFQAQSYALAEAAIACGAHYVDLADGRAFVTGIARLDVAARAAGVLVVSGASSVPALSAAVVDDRLADFVRLLEIDYGIVPAGDFDPGIATTRSILGYVGKPIRTIERGRAVEVYGWQDLVSHAFPNIGRRWLGACDIPDLDLFPLRYGDVETIRFRAGLAVAVMHFGMWGLSWLVRAGVLRGAERFAGPLLAMKRRLTGLGGDTGAMFVTLRGVGADQMLLELTWHLLAPGGRGPYVPPTPAVIITRKLLDGVLDQRGAMPALGLMTLAEFITETVDLGIATQWSDMAERPPARA